MAMTTEQLATLRAYVEAHADLLALDGNLTGLADALNADVAPDFIVTRTTISRHLIVTGESMEATVFLWAGNGYIGRTPGELAAFRDMFNDTGNVDPRKPNIQAAFADIFSGTGNAALNRAHIVAMTKRKASRFEHAFATGTGSLAVPGVLVLEGPISYQDLVGM